MDPMLQRGCHMYAIIMGAVFLILMAIAAFAAISVQFFRAPFLSGPTLSRAPTQAEARSESRLLVTMNTAMLLVCVFGAGVMVWVASTVFRQSGPEHVSAPAGPLIVGLACMLMALVFYRSLLREWHRMRCLQDDDSTTQ